MKEYYISPGGAFEWQVAKKGFRYIFINGGRYCKSDFNKGLKARGNYQIKESELYLFFMTDEKKDTFRLQHVYQ